MRHSVPDWLPASAMVDLALLEAGLKPAARIYVGNRANDLRRWGRRLGYFLSSDRDGFAVLSRRGSVARRALEIDRRPGRHTAALGHWLGYPSCCGRAAARVGDEGIDDYQRLLVRRRFRGEFTLIDPSGYLVGKACVSHVPCSHICAASLAMARRWPG